MLLGNKFFCDVEDLIYPRDNDGLKMFNVYDLALVYFDVLFYYPREFKDYLSYKVDKFRVEDRFLVE